MNKINNAVFSKMELANQKIYEDFDLTKANKTALLIKCYKYSLLAILFLFSTIILFLNKTTFFAERTTGITIFDFLKFDSLEEKESNIPNLMRIFILFFVFIYSLSKNYSNLNFQKELINRYWIWFSLYLSLTISSFGLLVGYDIYSKGIYEAAQKSFYLSFILIPLVLINISYSFYMYWYKRKTSPIFYNKKINLIIPNISQILLFLVIIISLSIWINDWKTSNYLTFDNNFYKFWNEVFNVRAFKNFFIMIAFFLFITLLLIGIYYQNIIFWILKEYTVEYFKNLILFIIAILFSLIIWFISIFGLKIEINLLIKNSFNVWAFALSFISSIIIFATYSLTIYIKKIKPKSNFINVIYFSLTNLLLWIVMLLTIFKSEDELVNRIMIFVISLLSFIIGLEFLINIKSLKRYDLLFIVLSLLSNISIIFLFGINQIMITNNNYTFLVVNTTFGIIEIFIIINIFIFLIFIFIAIGILINVILEVNGWKGRKFFKKNKGEK